MQLNRPFLIFPKLIEQPTWGGAYIRTYKGWHDRKGIAGKRIGQSYELYGGSYLSLNISDSADVRFTGYFSDPRKELWQCGNYEELQSLIKNSGSDILGPRIFSENGRMPILIKFTQALGNSFQLHVKPSDRQKSWLPKAESWYFLAKGKITFGINRSADIEMYRTVCEQIETFMKALSKSVTSGQLSVTDARSRAISHIRSLNPWQYVNVMKTEAGELIDLSGGGLHHSWEEDDSLPDGNIVYEVQQDVADDLSTIRSFDQGKIKDDGTIRPIAVSDYFRFLDTDPQRNDVKNARKLPDGECLLRTPYYSLDKMELKAPRIETTDSSFHHLWVLSGRISVRADGGVITLGKGHSCLVPYCVHSYTVAPEKGHAVILKTSIGNNAK